MEILWSKIEYFNYILSKSKVKTKKWDLDFANRDIHAIIMVEVGNISFFQWIVRIKKKCKLLDQFHNKHKKVKNIII